MNHIIIVFVPQKRSSLITHLYGRVTSRDLVSGSRRSLKKKRHLDSTVLFSYGSSFSLRSRCYTTLASFIYNSFTYSLPCFPHSSSFLSSFFGLNSGSSAFKSGARTTFGGVSHPSVRAARPSRAPRLSSFLLTACQVSFVTWVLIRDIPRQLRYIYTHMCERVRLLIDMCTLSYTHEY